VLRTERHADIAVWTVDRPEAKNALDHATLAAFVATVRDAAKDRTLRAAVIAGAGDVFVSGGDLRELRYRSSAEDAEHLSDAGFALTSASFPSPSSPQSKVRRSAAEPSLRSLATCASPTLPRASPSSRCEWA